MFRVEGVTVGDWRATVRRIGFGESTADLHVVPGENAFTITVDASGETLKNVDVVEKRTSLRLADFENAKRAASQAPS